MNHTDYLAALERLRRVASGEEICEVYGPRRRDEWLADKALVFDAEHDTQPATVEWLSCLPTVPFPVKATISLEGMRIEFMPNGKEIEIENPTRGDVLTLLRVFRERKV